MNRPADADVHPSVGAARLNVSRAPLAVTTSDRSDLRLTARARDAADQVRVPFVERLHQVPLSTMLAQVAEALVVFEAAAVSLVDSIGSVRFSPGLAHLRIKQLDKGVLEDPLWKMFGPCEADRVLDCTLGLASDAQVAARLKKLGVAPEPARPNATVLWARLPGDSQVTD